VQAEAAGCLRARVVARASDSEVRTRPNSLSVLEWVYPTTWEATIPAASPLTAMPAAGCSQVSKVCDLGEVPLPTRTRGGVLGAAHCHFFRSCDWPLATPGHPAPIEMPNALHSACSPIPALLTIALCSATLVRRSDG